MNVKRFWDINDFDNLGFHDSEIYSITFPQVGDWGLSLDIDYIFEWVLNSEIQRYQFWISPCKLIFHHVSAVKVNLDFGNTIGLSIDSIERLDNTPSPNGTTLWHFKIETHTGTIDCTATGMTLEVLAQPVFQDAYTLGRPL